MSINLQAHLDLAIQAAHKAGRFLAQQDPTKKKVVSSRGRDIHLAADHESERIIIETLRKGSDYAILAEETGEIGAVEGKNPVWIIDPLDGTVNYSRGIPFVCISIALCQKGKPLLGIIYDFVRNELFSGIVGQGAWLNGKPMKVSAITDAFQGILATGFPLRSSLGPAAIRKLANLIGAFKKTRMMGSAAMSIAYVACGRVEAYREQAIMFWDVAAGLALVRAAGGVVQTTPSPKAKWAMDVICASTRKIAGTVNQAL